MTSNGAYSTVNTSESHKTGRGCILADILEVEVDQKYFLSKEQTERIIFKSNSSEQEKVTTRSEYGKEIRKQYEAGELDISRHDFLEFEVREDGVSNTIDTVQKDNLLAVKPMQMSGYECDEQNGEAHTLNCSNQRKVFGANQTRTMDGYMLGMNATRDGGVLTDTALALHARDHKGLGTSKQLMTIAAVCLQSTKESNLTNEMSQTALSQEKTEDSLNENRKER